MIARRGWVLFGDYSPIYQHFCEGILESRQCSAVSQRLVTESVAGSLLSGVEDALSRGN